jgi:prephenate dehydrogenase
MAGDPRRVAIVGWGLIGGSIELALAQRSPGVQVVTLDRDDDLAAIAGADLVILAAPAGANIKILRDLRRHLAPGAVVTDTGSTKAAIVSAATGMRFVGGHPIAGTTTAGRAGARADLFVGRPWLLTPSSDARPDDTRRVRAFVEGLGAVVHSIDAQEHDRLFALLSHLPQLVVSALMHVVGTGAGADQLHLAGTGLRDSTRLASSPPEMWREILETNQANIASSLDDLIAVLTRLRDDESGEVLREIFESAAAWKQRLGGDGGNGISHGETE